LGLGCTMAPASALTGEFFDPNINSGFCKDTASSGSSAPESVQVSAPVLGPHPISCMTYQSARFNAQFIKWTYQIADAAACGALCMASQSCTYFNFHSHFGACGQISHLSPPSGPGTGGTFADSAGKIAGDCSAAIATAYVIIAPVTQVATAKTSTPSISTSTFSSSTQNQLTSSPASSNLTVSVTNSSVVGSTGGYPGVSGLASECHDSHTRGILLPMLSVFLMGPMTGRVSVH